MAKKSSTPKTNLEQALTFFQNSNLPFITSKVAGSYCTYIRNIQSKLTNLGNVRIFEDWIIPRIAKNDDLDDFELIDNIIKESFEPAFAKQNIDKKTKGNWRSALKAFARFILGQYKANIYLSLEKHTDEANCKLVAQYALFCTVDVAEKVGKGEIGSKLNLDKDTKYGKGKRGKTGNEYFSWFCCKFQRLSSADKSLRHKGKGDDLEFDNPQQDTENIGVVKYDDNSAANQAIKNAVIKGFPKWMRCKYGDFEDYMACHIWDGTCYDYKFHTSVFNLVLLPKSIGGLTDYCQAVKEILQYEAAMRFGVYPDGYGYKLSQSAQKIYNKIKHWRQPDEHNSAIDRIKNKLPQPQPLK